MLQDRRGCHAEIGGKLRDSGIAVAIDSILDDDGKDLSLTLREPARPFLGVHPGSKTLWRPLSVSQRTL